PTERAGGEAGGSVDRERVVPARALAAGVLEVREDPEEVGAGHVGGPVDRLGLARAARGLDRLAVHAGAGHAGPAEPAGDVDVAAEVGDQVGELVDVDLPGEPVVVAGAEREVVVGAGGQGRDVDRHVVRLVDVVLALVAGEVALVGEAVAVLVAGGAAVLG